MEQLICTEKHKQIDKEFEVVDKRLSNHDTRIGKLENDNSKFEERLDNLIEQLASLTATLKWFIGVFAGALIGFFFLAIQQKIF
jgi:chromosome segregation ATPase